MKATHIYILLSIILIAGLIFVRNSSSSEREEVLTVYDSFAQCLSDAGAKFYGAYWCPHCQEQKKQFQNSKKLPYIECSTPNGQAQTAQCISAGVTGYPTWDFADGSRLDGEQTFETLSEKTNCPLPTV